MATGQMAMDLGRRERLGEQAATAETYARLVWRRFRPGGGPRGEIFAQRRLPLGAGCGRRRNGRRRGGGLLRRADGQRVDASGGHPPVGADHSAVSDHGGTATRRRRRADHLHLRALWLDRRLSSGPQPGAVAATAGLRGGGAGARRLRTPDHAAPPGPERHGADHRGHDPGRGRVHPGRVGAVVPRAGDSTPHAVLGQHAAAGAGVCLECLLARHLSRRADLYHRAEFQLSGGRTARCARPPAEDLRLEACRVKRWALRRGWMALLAVLGAAALAGPATAVPGGRDTVVIGMAQEPDRLGAFSIMVAASVVEHALFAQAAPFTDRWVRMPVMVEKLPSLKDGDWVLLPNNKMKVTRRLRRGFSSHA